MADPILATERLPVPQEKSIPGNRYARTWRLTMEDPPSGALTSIRLQSLDKDLLVSIEAAQGKDLIVTSIRGQSVSLTDAYLAVWCAFVRLEQIATRIAFIEGRPRQDWQLQFLMVDHLLSLPSATHL